MEALAKFFVGLVTLANSVAPQANIPEVLGVQIAQDTSVTETSDLNVESGGLDDQTSRRKVRDAREEAKTKREEIVEEFKTKRETAKQERELRREEFKQKLAEIRDERKRRVVELLDLRTDKMLERWVEHWNKVLSRLTELLAKIESRADKAEAAGHDVAAVAQRLRMLKLP